MSLGALLIGAGAYFLDAVFALLPVSLLVVAARLAPVEPRRQAQPPGGNDSWAKRAGRVCGLACAGAAAFLAVYLGLSAPALAAECAVVAMFAIPVGALLLAAASGVAAIAAAVLWRRRRLAGAKPLCLAFLAAAAGNALIPILWTGVVFAAAEANLSVLGECFLGALALATAVADAAALWRAAGAARAILASSSAPGGATTGA